MDVNNNNNIISQNITGYVGSVPFTGGNVNPNNNDESIQNIFNERVNQNPPVEHQNIGSINNDRDVGRMDLNNQHVGNNPQGGNNPLPIVNNDQQNQVNNNNPPQNQGNPIVPPPPPQQQPPPQPQIDLTSVNELVATIQSAPEGDNKHSTQLSIYKLIQKIQEQATREGNPIDVNDIEIKCKLKEDGNGGYKIESYRLDGEDKCKIECKYEISLGNGQTVSFTDYIYAPNKSFPDQKYEALVLMKGYTENVKVLVETKLGTANDYIDVGTRIDDMMKQRDFTISTTAENGVLKPARVKVGEQEWDIVGRSSRYLFDNATNIYTKTNVEDGNTISLWQAIHAMQLNEQIKINRRRQQAQIQQNIQRQDIENELPPPNDEETISHVSSSIHSHATTEDDDLETENDLDDELSFHSVQNEITFDTPTVEDATTVETKNKETIAEKVNNSVSEFFLGLMGFSGV